MPTVFRAPDPLQSTFLLPGTNTPGTGVQVFTYVAGSSTKTTVYQDDAGTVAHANPIVLDSGGNVPGTGDIWIPSDVTIDAVYAPSNDTDPPVSPYRTVQSISGINDVSAQTGVQWVSGPTPTFVGTTRLTVAGDQTATLTRGRRIQTTNTGGTIYSTVTSSVFSTSTAIGVTNDSGVLDSGLSALSYGLLSATNPSIPVISDFYPSRSASSDGTKLFRVEVNPIPSSTTVVESLPIYSFRPATQNRGAAVSSNSTTNVSTATGDLIEITNTNAINQLTMFNGQLAHLYFTTTTPLNYSTTFPIPGNANMTTAAGDVLTVRGTSTEAVIIQSYKLQAQPPLQAGRVLIQSTTVTATTTIDFNNLTTQYDQYEVDLISLTPATQATDLQIVMSSSNGASYFGTAGMYRWGYLGTQIGAANATSVGNTNDSKFVVANLIGNGFTGGGVNVTIKFYALMNTVREKAISWSGMYVQTTEAFSLLGVGRSVTSTIQSAQINGLRFQMSSGGVSTALARLYGVRG